MRLFTLAILLFSVTWGYSQSLPIDFETAVGTSDFVDFDGGTATVLDNPQPNGINTSGKVAQIVRDGGATFAGSKIVLTDNLDFTTLNTLRMKVYTTAPVGTTVKFKLEGAGSAERDVQTTVSGEWEVLSWDFTATPPDFNTLVFMFDFGNVGDGSATSTFLFDDVEQIFGGEQIDLPITFEGSMVNYTMTDFEGAQSSLVADPEDASNMVMQVNKPTSAGTAAGTTMGTSAGFATNIPFSQTESEINVRVWSPDAGIPIRLKVEDANDPTHTCETEANTTQAGAWEVLTFDFTNEAPGTASLSTGLSNGWIYNKASIFFNFGTDGASAGEKTYYFDDVAFGEFMVGIQSAAQLGVRAFPNPSHQGWTVTTSGETLTTVQVYSLQGQRLMNLTPAAATAYIDQATLADGIYFCRITTPSGTTTMRLMKH